MEELVRPCVIGICTMTFCYMELPSTRGAKRFPSHGNQRKEREEKA